MQARYVSRLLPAVAAVASLVAFVAAVTGAALLDDRGEQDTAPKSGSAFLDLGGHVAVQDAENGLFFIDFARARALAGIAAPPPDASHAEIREYAEALALRTVSPLVRTPVNRFYGSSSANWNGEIGFNYGDIDQVLWTGGSTSPGVNVAAGRLQASSIIRALKTSSSIAKLVSTSTHAGVSYLTWSKPPPVNPAWPAGGSLIARDGLVVWSEDQGSIERSIDASKEPRLALTRLPELDLIARAFGELGVYVAFYAFTLDARWLGDTRSLMEFEYGRDLVRSQIELEPYHSIVVGIGQKGDSAYAVLILVHADESAARANVDKLREKVKTGISFHSNRPWHDTIKRADIRAEGRLLYAKLYSANLRLTFDAWANLDSLFLPEVED